MSYHIKISIVAFQCKRCSSITINPVRVNQFPCLFCFPGICQMYVYISERTVVSKVTCLAFSRSIRSVLENAKPGVQTPPVDGSFSVCLMVTMADWTIHSQVAP